MQEGFDNIYATFSKLPSSSKCIITPNDTNHGDGNDHGDNNDQGEKGHSSRENEKSHASLQPHTPPPPISSSYSQYIRQQALNLLSLPHKLIKKIRANLLRRKALCKVRHIKNSLNKSTHQWAYHFHYEPT